MSTNKPIRIAISGGGIAGATLMHSLAKSAHLDVHIFESAPSFTEIGAAVGLSENSLRSLDIMDATQCLHKAGAVQLSDVRIMVAEGPDAGQVVGDIEVKAGRRRAHIVHRAALLRELLAEISPDRMHASKKLVRIEDGDGTTDHVTLHFEDQSMHECDVLIGADGIHSFVRRHILEDGDPSASAVYAGWWAVQCLKPFKDVQNALGEDLMNTRAPRETNWIGNGSYLMHNVLDDGATAQIAACFWTGTEGKSWARRTDIPVKEIRRIYQNWPSNVKAAIEKVLCEQPEQPAYYFWEHLPAPTYVKGGVGIIGDAAHSTTPWQASGAAMSIEDSMVMWALLSHVRSPPEAKIALKVYDLVRRPRTQRIVESSNVTGQMFTGQYGETGLDRQKLKDQLLHRWEFIIELDMDQHRDEALAFLRSQLTIEQTNRHS